ncbi:MAG TPA: SGNH/GDSL hydrolase family protein [Thermoanaerobaculia bacterium]|nr:SGNH/GDSL hydrolase family protein [Thermoanaerobaculia bacterium]
MARLVGGLLLALLAAMSLLVLAEAGLRVAGRVGGGAWPRTRAAEFYDQVLLLRSICRDHPFLNTAPRPGAAAVVFGKSAALNRLGYRSPERPRAKPPGVRRVVAAGGSTTFDVLADDNGATWPSRLEERLRASGRPVEVWNAGFPGWTTLESLISLAIRDVDLAPDVVLLYHAVNDLQPASHEPFDPQYDGGHAGISRKALGLDLPPPSWLDRLLLVERLRGLAGGPSDPWQALAVKGSGRRRERIGEAGIAAFERNVRSFVALAGSRGATVVLMTQPLRLRAAHREADLAHLAGWYPELDPAAAPHEIARLNDVLRRLGAEGVGELADVARDIPWTDEDFGDPVHYAAPGREKLVGYLAPRIP